jgi:uncharacterized protein
METGSSDPQRIEYREREARPTYAPTDRSRVRRVPQRATYDAEHVHAILDAGYVAHVGIAEGGQPFVLPMVYVRVDRTLYLHGARTARLLSALAEGVPMCATVTLLDGLVLARSAFHHSLNYRSVMVLGRGVGVVDEAERERAFAAFVDHVVPGRSADVRPPNEQERRATMLVKLPIDEASAKVRTGPPLDDAEDLSLPVWAGVLPLTLTPGVPLPDPALPAATPLPASLARYARR